MYVTSHKQDEKYNRNNGDCWAFVNLVNHKAVHLGLNQICSNLVEC